MSKTKNQIKSEQQLARARAGLIIDQPFFASLLLPMPISECMDIPTAVTDGDSIVYNPDWMAELNQNETTFLLAHEVLHCVFDHMGRRESREHNRWNQAADYIINDLLQKERIGTMPKGGLLDSALVKRGKETAEGVYKILPKSAEKNKPGEKGGSMDSVLDAGSKSIQKDSKTGKTSVVQGKPVDSATAAKKSADMKVRVIQATNAAKMQGKLSAGMERLVGELVKPVVDWREVLRRFVSERAKVEYSFARPKRRFLGEDLYLPSLTGEKLGEIVVAVDASGSVSLGLLTKFSAEINAIKQDVHPSKITVIYFDSRVVKIESFEAEQDVKLTPCGGGGTAYSPVFKHIASMPEQPMCAIFLTDLKCNDFGDAPSYPVLWAVIENSSRINRVPFGETVLVEEDDNK